MVTDIAHWLRKQPVAVDVRCDCADGQVRTVRIDGKSKRRFVDAEEAIVNMRAVKLDARDAKGNTLRVTDLEGPADGGVVVPVAANEAQSNLAHFASLLSKAVQQGADAAMAPMKASQETMGQLLNFALKRIGELEAQHVHQMNVHSKLLDKLRDAASRVDGETEEGNLLQGLIGQFMLGMGGAQHAPHANGAAHPEGKTDA